MKKHQNSQMIKVKSKIIKLALVISWNFKIFYLNKLAKFLPCIFYFSLDSMASSASILFLIALGAVLFQLSPSKSRIHSVIACVFVHNLTVPLNI